MVSKDGRAFSCGHGQGGRLGLGDVNTAMKPTQINFHSRTSPTNICKQAAIGRDHSMFLMDSNTVRYISLLYVGPRAQYFEKN